MTAPRVLVAEDEPEILNIMMECIRRLKVPVQAIGFHEGQSVLSQARLCEVQLLITDFSLGGGMNGLDLIEKVYNLRPTVQVILVSGTAFADMQVPDSIYLHDKKHVHSFLAKPFSVHAFSRQVLRLLGGRLPPAEAVRH